MTQSKQTDAPDLSLACQRCAGGHREDGAVVICLICELELAKEAA